MKSFLVACVVAIVIAAIGGVVLNGMQQQADKAYTLPDSVRIGA
jgi:hypothetical protein